MCLIDKCSGNKAHTVQWGLEHKLCEVHYADIVKRLTNDGAVKIKASYLSDFVGLKAMMLEMDTVMKQMAWLAVEIDAAIELHKLTPDDEDDRFREERKLELDYIRISRVLENYEGYCWFPPCHRIFTGGLSAPDFYWYLEHGYMVKDPGPNVYHGDFTHRYQWHAIMRHLTNNFTNPSPTGGWNHTPLQLYVGMASGDAKNAGIWGKVVDRDGASPPDVVDYETFSNPNTLHKRLREGKFTRLTENTNRRFLKRKTAVEAAGGIIANWKKAHGGKWSEWMMNNTEPADTDIAGLLYAWRKNGGNPMGVQLKVPDLVPKGGSESGVDFKKRQDEWRFQKRLAHAARIIKSSKETSVNKGHYEEFEYKPGAPHYQFIVTPESLAGFVVLAETLDKNQIQYVSEKEIAQRVEMSLGSFDLGHYQYGKSGAKKIKTTDLPLK